MIFIFPPGIELILRSNGSTGENRQDYDNFHHFQKLFTPGVGNFKIKTNKKRVRGVFLFGGLGLWLAGLLAACLAGWLDGWMDG